MLTKSFSRYLKFISTISVFISITFVNENKAWGQVHTENGYVIKTVISASENTTFYPSLERKENSDRNSATLTDNDSFNVFSIVFLKTFNKQSAGFIFESGTSERSTNLNAIGERDYKDFISLGIVANRKLLLIGKEKFYFYTIGQIKSKYKRYSGEQLASMNHRKDFVNHSISIDGGLYLGLSFKISDKASLMFSFHPLSLDLGTHGFGTYSQGYSVALKF